MSGSNNTQNNMMDLPTSHQNYHHTLESINALWTDVSVFGLNSFFVQYYTDDTTLDIKIVSFHKE